MNSPFSSYIGTNRLYAGGRVKSIIAPMSNYLIFAFSSELPAECLSPPYPEMQSKVPMLRRETRVPPGFAVENVARIGSSIWESKSTIFDNWKDTGFEVDWARFSAPAAAEKTHSTLYIEEDNNQKEP